MKSLITSALALTLAVITAATLYAAESSVSGTFIGDGKPAKLAFVSARKGEPLSDKETTVFVFTEKDHSKEKRPDIKAGFGDFGSALIITINSEGKIVGCEVAHKAHKKSPFSSLGNVNASDYKVEGGKVSGKIATEGKVEAFGQTWETNLTFQTKAP
jgi:hypothetical protein